MEMPKLSLSLLVLLGTAFTTTTAEPPSPNYVYSNYDSPYSQPDEYNPKGQGGRGGSGREPSEYPAITDNPHDVDDAGYPIGGSGSFMPGGTQGADDYGYTELNPKYPYQGPAHKPMTHSYSPPNAYSPAHHAPPRPHPPPRQKPFRMSSLFRLRSRKPAHSPKYHSHSSYNSPSYVPAKPAYSSYGTLPGKSYSPTQYAPQGYKPQSSYKNYSPPSYPQHAPSGPGGGVSHSPSMYAYGGNTSPKPSKRPSNKPHHAPPTKETVKIKYTGHMPPPPKFSPKGPSGYRYSSYDGTAGVGGGHQNGGSGNDDEDLFGRQFCKRWLPKDYDRYIESYSPPNDDDAYGGGFDMGTSHY